MTTTIYPNGQVLTSNALTKDQFDLIFQSLTCDLLGLAVNDPARNTTVRIAWQVEGAPAWGITDDLVFVEALEEDGVYNKLRDMYPQSSGSPNYINVQFEYTRIWRVIFIARGPNSMDNIRLIKSGLLQAEFVYGTLSDSNLYLMPEIGNAIRAPELKQGRWWERTDLHVIVYEQINETLQTGTVKSIEIIGYDDKGQIFDITATKPN